MDSIGLKVEVVWALSCHAHLISRLAALGSEVCPVMVAGATRCWKSRLTSGLIVYQKSSISTQVALVIIRKAKPTIRIT